jgi:hypothetical protein
MLSTRRLEAGDVLGQHLISDVMTIVSGTRRAQPALLKRGIDLNPDE